MEKQKIALALGVSAAASVSLLAATSPERYVYDASGNIVEKQIGDKITQFDYAGNLLKESSKGTCQTKFGYDSSGRLIQEIMGGSIVRKLEYQFSDKITKVEREEGTTEFFYNAEGQLVGESDGAKLSAIAWDGLAMVLRDEQAYTLESHQIGEVPTLTDDKVVVSDLNGTTLSIGRRATNFTAYGEGGEGGFFTGKFYLEGLAGFIFKFRSYSPNTARWMTVDPSGYPDGRNNYQYTSSDPVNFYDPNGLNKLSWKVSDKNVSQSDKDLPRGSQSNFYRFRLNGSIKVESIDETSATATLFQDVQRYTHQGIFEMPGWAWETKLDLNDQPRRWRISCNEESGSVVVSRESGVMKGNVIHSGGKLRTFVSVEQNSDFVIWTHMAQWDPEQESGINAVELNVPVVGFNVSWIFAENLNREWGHTNTFEFECEQ